MKRVEDYEAWENVKKQEKAFIKTVKGSSKSILKNPNPMTSLYARTFDLFVLAETPAEVNV